MDIHTLDVGCGNMVICLNPDGTRVVIDCNITQDNKKAVLGYVARTIGSYTGIDVFINTHRDADHMRGIRELHSQHPITAIWDPDVPGTTNDSPEYQEYMSLRRSVTTCAIKPHTHKMWGTAKYKFMNSKWPDYTDTNEQSLVVKIEYNSPSCSVLFAGDTNSRPWKEKILTYYGDLDLESAILIASHHGSYTFFENRQRPSMDYVEHIKKIKPDMTLVSVGPNPHGLPDPTAVRLYERYSAGAAQGHKVLTTQDDGNMKIRLKDNGLWELSVDQ